MKPIPYWTALTIIQFLPEHLPAIDAGRTLFEGGAAREGPQFKM
jgi:hypothetical protein